MNISVDVLFATIGQLQVQVNELLKENARLNSLISKQADSAAPAEPAKS